MKKPSFFERLTGSHYYNEDEVEEEIPTHTKQSAPSLKKNDGDNEMQLAVDVYQTPDQIVIEAMIGAVKPEDLDITITRESVTIRAHRTRSKSVDEDQFFYRELFWGDFARTILLPQEVEPDEADAREKGGLLTIILPKIHRDRQTKLKVRSGQI